MQDQQLQANVDSVQDLLAGQVATCTQLQGTPSQVPAPGGDNGSLLFQPGVLEALSSAVAARIATADGGTKNNAVRFTFSAAKNSMQGNSKKKDKKKRCQTELRMPASKY